MIVLQGSLPVQTVVKTIVIHQGYLACLVQTGIIERSLLQLTSTHITIGHIIIYRKIRSSSELKISILLHASIAYIDKWSTLGSIAIHVMAIGILIHGSELTTIAVILLGEECLVNLSTVLIRSRLNLEGSRVEILIHIKAVVPVLTQITIHIQREFLQSEMIALIVQRTIESFLSLLGERVHGITDITGSDGSLGNLEQTLMAQTCITTPDSIDRMRIGNVSNRQTILQHVDIGRRQAYLNLTRTIRTGCIEHHITITLFLST